MFNKYTINTPPNIFNQLSTNIIYEDIAKGRKGTNIVDYQNRLIPIVRTTSVYNNPVQKFLPIHYEIIQNIKNVSGINLELNNGLVELYDETYNNMRFHTDQSLDLETDSYICVFSCYEKEHVPSEHLRKLVVKHKVGKYDWDIPLEQNSVVIFNTKLNQEHLHKIILNPCLSRYPNKWLGITFRLSKTFIRFVNELPYFDQTNVILRLGNQEEIKKFIRLKGIENTTTTFVYPFIDYTNSPSDVMPIQ